MYPLNCEKFDAKNIHETTVDHIYLKNAEQY